jgi:hypothetical protein
MKSSMCFIRIRTEDQERFSNYLSLNRIKNTLTSIDLGPGLPSATYSIRLTHGEEMSIRLSFNLIGLMKFDSYNELVDLFEVKC